MNEKGRWDEVRALFEAALAMEESARGPFLAERCAGDDALRAEVERLLSAARTDDFLDDDVAGLAADAFVQSGPDAIGRIVGPFRLTAPIGEGGMGRVYVGERVDDSFRQRVAVKLIGATFASPELVGRFEREREILASLTHPNIAHLIDGGVSELGPYLAMELVEDAADIVRHSDAHALDVRSRVELFATVCEAVHAAHQKLIVHRDLKPSNVLVTDDGRVTLLDFGIAGLLDDGAGSEAKLTKTGRLLMTPEYASPEQLRGEPVTTATDVYSLGVMLYEVLSGTRPYDLEGLSPGEVERRVGDQPVPRPSEVAEQGRPLRGDLDTIIAKAMHRDPTRRYHSAAAMAEDLRRHLANQPVQARPDTLTYRLSSFGRRHRGGVIAASLLTLTLMGGAATTFLQARRADTRFDETRELATSMLSELNRALADVPGSTQVRAMLVQEALTYLDELSSDPRADRGHLLDVADAYDQVGEIQGDPTSTNLGDLAAARDSYEQAMRIREALWIVDSTDARTRWSLAASYHKLATVTGFEGDLNESTRLGQVGLELLAPLESGRTTGDSISIVGGRLRTVVGENLVNNGAWEVGPAMLDTAVTLLEGAVDRRPGEVRLVTDLWDAYNGQATVLWYTRRAADGLQLLDEKACPMLRRLVDDNPNRASALYGLHQCHDYRGQALEQLGRLEESEASYRTSIDLAESLLTLDPLNETAHEAVSSGHLALGRLLFRTGRPDQGAEALGRSVDLSEQLRANNPSNGRWTFQVATVQRELCRSLLESGDPASALPSCLASVEAHGLAAEVGPGVITDVTLAFAHGQTGRAYRALASTAPGDQRDGLLDDAIDHFERSVAAYDRVGDLGPDAAYEIHPDGVRNELESARSARRTGSD